MGWTNMHRDKGQSNAEFFQKEFFPSGHHRILADATIGGAYYAAVETLPSSPHGTPGEVWGLVVLIQWGGGYFNFTYKEMDENMGPGVHAAPARVLDRLTATDHEAALEWRAQCRAFADRAAESAVRLKGLQEGDEVVLRHALPFSDGTKRDRFTVAHRRDRAGRRQVILTAGGSVYRVPRWRSVVVDVVRGS